MSRRERTRALWVSYGILFAVVFFLERCVCNRFPLFGAVPLAAPVVVALAGSLEGAWFGTAFGLAAGVLCALVYQPVGAAMVWACTALGLACGLTVNRTMGRTFLGCLLCALGGVVWIEAVQAVPRLLFLEQDPAAVGRIAGAEALYSALFAPLLYPVVRAIHERFGLEPDY